MGIKKTEGEIFRKFLSLKVIGRQIETFSGSMSRSREYSYELKRVKWWMDPSDSKLSISNLISSDFVR